ncbi:hypothetical protein [Agromyces sp. ZXT2-6]|uniref:hypothetical protein n=1 Tax=Agromyces sp. ZXT2-6 TaxID=3461153 RepID=UPI00405513F9
MPLPLPRTRRARLIAGGAAVTVLVGGLAIGAQAATAAASTDLDAALSTAATTVADARDRYDALIAEQEAANERLETTETTVLDQSSRDTLAAALDETEQRSVAARAEIEAAETVLEQGEGVDPSIFAFGAPQRDAAADVEALEFDDLDRFEESVAALDAPVEELAAAVAAWDERQALIASASYANHVWASGWYPELDACKGSVDLTARYDDVPTIAEHWSCGGKDFPDDPGTVIRLTGVHEGVYRVEGIVKMLDQDTATSNDLPRGYDLIYQTCQNGQSSSMSITALTKIG